VCTNNKSKIENKNINIVETNKKFNYNLKKESIKIALKSFDNILYDIFSIFDIRQTIINNLLRILEKCKKHKYYA
jgi:hypothetical protein